MQARLGGQTEEIARHRDRPNQLGGVLMDQRPELLKPEAARVLAKPDASEPVVLDAGKRPAAKRSRPARARGAQHLALLQGLGLWLIPSPGL